MNFFIYHMPPLLTVLGALYVLVALPQLVKLLGYWRGMLPRIGQILRQNLLRVAASVVMIVLLISYLDLPLTLSLVRLDKVIHSYTFWDFICSCAEGGFVSAVIFTLVLLADSLGLWRLALVSRISLMTSIYGGLANALLKFIFNRQRPAIGLDQWHFFAFFSSSPRHWLDLTYAFNSMPSGHTLSTVAAITPFFLAYPNKWVRGALVLWALLVSFSRIYTLNHWLSDVTLAALLGVVVGVAGYQLNSWRLSHA